MPIQRIVNNKTVVCSNSGCNDQVTVSTLKMHENLCGFALGLEFVEIAETNHLLVTCNCGKKFLKKEKTNHDKFECSSKGTLNLGTKRKKSVHHLTSLFSHLIRKMLLELNWVKQEIKL